MNYFRSTKIGSMLVLVLLFSFSGLGAKGRGNIGVQPVGAKGVILTVQDNQQIYFQLDKSKAMRLALDGPGKLKVFTRLNFSPDLKGLQKYSLEIKEKEKIVKAYSTTTERSKASFRDSKLVPGKSRKFTLDVPEGSHTYEFSIRQAPSPVISLRFSFDPKDGPGKLASITPLSYSKVVTAFIKEKLVSYFVATADYEVKLRVIGPTQVRIVSRLNYDAEMKGQQKYGVLASENGKTILTKPLVTTKSVGVEYKDWKEVVPGKSQTFFLDVPAGEHTYGFKLTGSIAQSVSLRFSIPQESLTNEE